MRPLTKPKKRIYRVRHYIRFYPDLKNHPEKYIDKEVKSINDYSFDDTIGPVSFQRYTTLEMEENGKTKISIPRNFSKLFLLKPII